MNKLYIDEEKVEKILETFNNSEIGKLVNFVQKMEVNRNISMPTAYKDESISFSNNSFKRDNLAK